MGPEVNKQLFNLTSISGIQRMGVLRSNKSTGDIISLKVKHDNKSET